ncbi:glyoxylate/hydroxypyruvate reductase A [Salinisphaera sp. T31B1]|uniref:2-hydroxyacid dehydrogenase n=1 Tax=Salinisphaera sp. T31B1 TaxID=727963 RepID=UPI0033402F27
MTATLLYWGPDDTRAARWQALFAARAPSITFRRSDDPGDAADVDYLLSWQPPDDILGRFPSLRAIFATSAGVDQFDLAAIPERVPVVRMFDPQIEAGVVEYASTAVLYLHREFDRYRHQQHTRAWMPHAPLPATARRVGILGLGSLGRAIARRLVTLGFEVLGWARSAHTLPGVACFQEEDGLARMLAVTDILICMLPLTEATRGMLDRSLFEQLPRGACLVNMGRGGHLVEADLSAALDDGILRGAVLDVLDSEPPAPDHPFWSDPRILLTPHIAAMTNPDTAFDVLMANIERDRKGEAMIGRVDRWRGY